MKRELIDEGEAQELLSTLDLLPLPQDYKLPLNLQELSEKYKEELFPVSQMTFNRIYEKLPITQEAVKSSALNSRGYANFRLGNRFVFCDWEVAR